MIFFNESDTITTMTFHHIIHNNPYPKVTQITVDGTRYYKTEEGNILLPSVTTVLSKADKDKNIALAKWKERKGEKEANKIRNNSAARGKGLHKACEEYLKNNPEYSKGVMPNAMEFFRTIRPFMDKIDNIHYQEKAMYSTRLGLAGTVDTIAEYDNILSCIDYKNAKSLRTEKMIFTYFLQATAYGLMYNEWMGGSAIKQIVVMMAVENEPIPQIFIKKLSDYVKPLLQIISNYTKENINNK